MMEFFAMGGYALYVWPCYLIALIIMALFFFQSRSRARSLKRQIDHLLPEGRRGSERRGPQSPEAGETSKP